MLLDNVGQLDTAFITGTFPDALVYHILALLQLVSSYPGPLTARMQLMRIHWKIYVHQSWAIVLCGLEEWGGGGAKVFRRNSK